MIKCPKCKKIKTVVKHGMRHNKTKPDTQRYTCKECKYRFVKQ